MTDVATTPALAPDHELPGRDLLLDPVAVAARLPGLLGADGPLELDDCTLVRVKYRVGESLRAVYRLGIGGRDHLVTARLFPPGRDRTAYERATASGPPASGPLRAVVRDADLGAVWWSFPRDRKLGDLGWLTAPDRALGQDMGLPAWRRTDVVQYVPERSVTVRALDGRGATLAYAKAYGPHVVRPSVVAGRHQRLARELRRTPDPVSAPDCLAWSDARGLLLMEAMPGRHWNELAGDDLERALRDLGVAVAHVHDSPPAYGLPAFGRLRPDRVEHSAGIVGRARPDVAQHAQDLARRLREAAPAPAPDVVLHGDCHPGNALLEGGSVALVDLDQMGHGPAAADLGSLLARLRYAATIGEIDAADAAVLEVRFLGGYAERRPLPDLTTLAWHTAAALLAERALRAVNRVNGAALARLDELMVAADKALDRGVLR
jgi:Ser/Thr protein kinase RdoA (MazF antagonist)